MYRIDDIDMINKNLSKIQDEASKEYKTKNEPTLAETSSVYNSIKEYIKKNKKLVYGGFAQNLLIQNKNPDEAFYKEIDGAYYNWPDLADIEFYSPDPIKDTIELVDYLHSKGFKNIQGKEGVHTETYKIFVNFLNYCDISYVPPNIYEKIPYIDIHGMRCVHPHFMMIDAYRVLTDPMTSYWRVDKSIKRFQKLLRYYPIDNTVPDNNINFNKQIATKDLQFIRRKIIHKSRLIVVGFYAYDYYMKKANKQYMLNRYPYYEVISTDYIKDSDNIYNIMKNKYSNRLVTKEYKPFFNFTDERTEFYLDDKLVLILYGNNKRCIVYTYSEKKTVYFGTFNLVYMYMLFANYMNNMNNMNTMYKILASRMMDGRNKYLDSHNKTVVDKSPFQDFTIKCMGKPIEPTRDMLLNCKSDRFIYHPGDKIKLYKNDYSNNSGLIK